MQNRIKLFLFALFTPLLCLGVSFGAYDIYGGLTSIYSNSYSWSSASSSNTIVANFSPNKTYCGIINGGTSNYAITYVRVKCQSNNTTYIVSNGNVGKGKYFCFTNYMCTSNANLVIETSGAPMSSSYNVTLYSVDLPVSVESNDCSSIEQELATMSGNYDTCLSTLNDRNGQIGSLSGQLASCNSDLASCTNSCDTLVAQCQENLSGCNADLSSMTNYKDSLESQLQQCLGEIPEPCTGTGCDEVSTGLNAVFSFFWERDDNMFSLPISNNIFLPRGITAYIDSGVVALAEEEKQKIKIDQGFEVLSGTYYHFFIGIIMLGIFCLFAYYVKKFISKSFIPKEK